MAVQSKLLPPSRSLKQLLSKLTTLYLKNRTNISRTVYITLVVALIHRIHNAISEQKAAARRQAEIQRERARQAAQQGVGEDAIAASKQPQQESEEGAQKKPKRVAINRAFFRSLLRLLKIVIPGWKS